MRLLSRNAEALFWLARYLERSSSLARVIEMQSSFGAHDPDTGWNWLLALHSDEARFKQHFELSTTNIIAFYLTDSTNPGSIRSSIHWARENARALRPFIPTEMWAQLNTFHGAMERLTEDDLRPSRLPRTCADIRAGCLAQIGIAEGTLFRDEGYQFFRLGLMIERADQTSRLLDVKFAQNPKLARTLDPADDFVFWSTILRTAAAYQVYHRLQPESADPQNVARFLLLNPSHPRSVGFCVREIGETLNILRSAFHLKGANACLEGCEVIMEGLQSVARETALLDRLHAINDGVQRALIDLCAHISTAFFPQAPAAPKTEPPVVEAPKEPTTGQSQTQEQRQS